MGLDAHAIPENAAATLVAAALEIDGLAGRTDIRVLHAALELGAAIVASLLVGRRIALFAAVFLGTSSSITSATASSAATARAVAAAAFGRQIRVCIHIHLFRLFESVLCLLAKILRNDIECSKQSMPETVCDSHSSKSPLVILERQVCRGVECNTIFTGRSLGRNGLNAAEARCFRALELPEGKREYTYF